MTRSFIACVLFAQMRDVKSTQDDMKKQVQLDHEKVTQQLQTVTWQLDRVTEKLEKQIFYMHLWCTVLVGITFGMYVCMLFMVQHGRYSACYVPRQNVTDDGRSSGPTVDDLQGLFDLFGMRPSLE